jgi:hypothetical protein
MSDKYSMHKKKYLKTNVKKKRKKIKKNYDKYIKFKIIKIPNIYIYNLFSKKNFKFTILSPRVVTVKVVKIAF